MTGHPNGDAPRVDKCSSPKCRAPIVWGVTVTTKNRMPIDAAPDPAGNVEAYVRRGQLHIVTVHAAGQSFLPAHPVWMPHWATCADPDRFRRKAK